MKPSQTEQQLPADEASQQSASSDSEVFRGGSDCLTIRLSHPTAGTIVRKIGAGRRAKKLQAQYDWLRDREGDEHVPRTLGYQHSEYLFSYDMEFVEGLPLQRFLQNATEDEAQSAVENLLKWVHERLHASASHMESLQAADRYLREKLQDKVEAAIICLPVLRQINSAEFVTIDGRRQPGFRLLLQKIKEDQLLRRELSTFHHATLHGDLTVENCVWKSGGVVVAFDPNDENYISDPIVDYAKLLQSFDGHYEYLSVVDKVDVTPTSISFLRPENLRYQRLSRVIREFIKHSAPSSQSDLLDLHIAIHFARLLPYKALQNVQLLPVYYAQMLAFLYRFCRRRYHL